MTLSYAPEPMGNKSSETEATLRKKETHDRLTASVIINDRAPVLTSRGKLIIASCNPPVFSTFNISFAWGLQSESS